MAASRAAIWWFFGWIATLLALFTLVLAGILLAQEASVRNDQQDLQLAVLQANITYLNVLEQLTATNITDLAARLDAILATILTLNADVAATETDILTLLNVDAVAIQSNLTAIDASLVTIQSTLVQQQLNYSAYYNVTLLLQQAVQQINNTLYAHCAAQYRFTRCVWRHCVSVHDTGCRGH